MPHRLQKEYTGNVDVHTYKYGTIIQVPILKNATKRSISFGSKDHLVPINVKETFLSPCMTTATPTSGNDMYLFLANSKNVYSYNTETESDFK